MGNDEGQDRCYPVAVCPHLGRTGLLTHKIRELEARQREEAGCPGGNRQTDTSPSSIPSLAHQSQADLAVCQNAQPWLKTLPSSLICNETCHISARARRKPESPKYPTPHWARPFCARDVLPFPTPPNSHSYLKPAHRAPPL